MSTVQPKLSGLKPEKFQKEINGKKTDLYTLVNSDGYEVSITNYGGAIVAIMVPDKDGKVANVIQGQMLSILPSHICQLLSVVSETVSARENSN